MEIDWDRYREKVIAFAPETAAEWYVKFFYNELPTPYCSITTLRKNEVRHHNPCCPAELLFPRMALCPLNKEEWLFR